MNVEKFKSWLVTTGADIVPVTNQWEVLRFRTPNGTSVIYKNKKGAFSFQGESKEAFEAFKNKSIWFAEPQSLKTKRKKKHELLNRDGGCCFYCRKDFKPEQLTIEHILSVAHGGNNDLANLALSCQECNQAVGDLPIVEKIKYRENFEND